MSKKIVQYCGFWVIYEKLNIEFNPNQEYVDILVERHVEPTFSSLGGLENNGVRDFFTGFQLSHNFGSKVHNIGRENNPTVKTIHES